MTSGLKNDYWKCIDDTLYPVRSALVRFTNMNDETLMNKPRLDIDVNIIKECRFQ